MLNKQTIEKFKMLLTSSFAQNQASEIVQTLDYSFQINAMQFNARFMTSEHFTQCEINMNPVSEILTCKT